MARLLERLWEYETIGDMLVDAVKKIRDDVKAFDRGVGEIAQQLGLTWDEARRLIELILDLGRCAKLEGMVVTWKCRDEDEW